ncbi:type VII secretion-associated serine protease mycosin [Paenibacillus endophyticus]|uniref:Type VII secretion-associated serine protease mycosin n=1 Tax=Paenibacillus endophyticus TaxID=1294268 RepID=A0A7W5C4N7_9BACL|nr:S8 family peptidase [Paenibacillus endophyticus]MBB3151098.1 type VII secretion-associated serine protease mycosin [Paenibacillus endophyticus]
MLRKWIGALTILALAALLIPTTPLFAPKEVKKEPQSSSFTAKREHTLKIAAVQSDLKATAMLCASECSKDFQKLMHASMGSKAAASQQIQHMMHEHMHMSYISWISGKRSVDRGVLPKTDKNQIEAYVKDAKAQVSKGAKYESDAVTAKDGSRYMVLGVPDAKHVGIGVVGVIKQDILKSVEQHQMRNLRLIPYPAEGNYKIESVKPNSTIDTAVRSGEDNGNASHYHIRDVVVHFTKPLTPNELERVKRDINAESMKQVGDTFIFRSRNIETDQLVQYFKQTWNTEYTEPHYLYMTNESTSIVPNDALYSEYQWNLPSIETEKGWNISKGNEEVIIAVLDTGVQSNHPDLKGKITKGINIVDETAEPDDDVGHGTHVSGIIGATVNNSEGVAGLSWYNKIMPIKVLDSSGAGSTYSVAQGIIWAVDHGAKVINMSLGNYAQADFLHDAIKYAYEHDVVMIAASGNDNTDRPGYPAAYPEVFAVAATDSNKEKASFSNYGNYIDVAAPGDSIASTYPGSQYAALSGTSMASPHVAALAGLIRSVNPELSNEEVMELMRTSASDLGAKGKDDYFGYGEIDIVRALQAASKFGGALQTYPDQVKRRLERIASQPVK